MCISIFVVKRFSYIIKPISLERSQKLQPSFFFEDFWKKTKMTHLLGVYTALFQALFCDDAPVAASNRYVAAPKRYLY